jgi:hypothetical protein
MGMVNYLNKLKNYCLPSFLFFPITSNRHARESGHLRFGSKKTQIPAFAGMTCSKNRIKTKNYPLKHQHSEFRPSVHLQFSSCRLAVVALHKLLRSVFRLKP